jgi:hypothetical protein
MTDTGALRIGPQTHLHRAAVCPKVYAHRQTTRRRPMATIVAASMT